MKPMVETQISSQDTELLEMYKKISHSEPVALSLEDMPKILALTEELHIAEKEDASKIAKINRLEEGLKERMIQIETLRSQLNPKLQYLSMHKEIKVKPMNHNASVSLSPINETTVLETLKSNYALGNSEICKKLGLTGNKAEQNKAYSVAKQLEAKGLIKNENRMWKAI